MGYNFCRGVALASSFVHTFAPMMVAASVCGVRGEPARQPCEYAKRIWCFFVPPFFFAVFVFPKISFPEWWSAMIQAAWWGGWGGGYRLTHPLAGANARGAVESLSRGIRFQRGWREGGASLLRSVLLSPPSFYPPLLWQKIFSISPIHCGCV